MVGWKDIWLGWQLIKLRAEVIVDLCEIESLAGKAQKAVCQGHDQKELEGKEVWSDNAPSAGG